MVIPYGEEWIKKKKKRFSPGINPVTIHMMEPYRAVTVRYIRFILIKPIPGDLFAIVLLQREDGLYANI